MENKETLEEAAERLFNYHSNNTSLAEGHYDYMMDNEDFKQAAYELVKWQQERSYSEEEVMNIIDSFIDNFDSRKEWFKQFKKK